VEQPRGRDRLRHLRGRGPMASTRCSWSERR
jgi:hypothetical protein